MPALVERHWGWLVRRCRPYLGGDLHAAEDVAQECFLKLGVMLAGEAPLRVRPWLTVVARNRCIDLSRRRTAEPVAETPELAEEPSLGAVEAGGHPELVRAWSSLRDRHRKVLELRELGGLSYQEIAVALAITPSAVETLLFRARNALRREYVRAGGLVTAAAPIDELAAKAGGRTSLLERLLDVAAAPDRRARLADAIASKAARASAVRDELVMRASTSPLAEAATTSATRPSGVGRALGTIAAAAALLVSTAPTTSVPSVPTIAAPAVTVPATPQVTVPAAPPPSVPAVSAPSTTTAPAVPATVGTTVPATTTTAPAPPLADAVSSVVGATDVTSTVSAATPFVEQTTVTVEDVVDTLVDAVLPGLTTTR